LERKAHLALLAGLEQLRLRQLALTHHSGHLLQEGRHFFPAATHYDKEKTACFQPNLPRAVVNRQVALATQGA
jgi:hypothetical protein